METGLVQMTCCPIVNVHYRTILKEVELTIHVATKTDKELECGSREQCTFKLQVTSYFGSN